MTDVLRLPNADAPAIVQRNPTHCSACGRKIRVRYRRGCQRWLNHERGCERSNLYPDVDVKADERKRGA